MDDNVLLALGRLMLDNAMQREAMIRKINELQAKLQEAEQAKN